MTNPELAHQSNERFVLPSNVTLEELLDRLVEGRIPVHDYGVGNAKTIHHLLSEVNEGESIITIDDKGDVHREVNVLWIDVLCELSDGSIYYLKEDRQDFKNGKTKRRELDSSIGEKLKPLESPEEAVRRAISEELGVNDYTSLYNIGYKEKTFIPDTFPGIESTYKMYQFVSMIPETAYNKDGYVEYQVDKTNYYTWELLRHAPKN